MQVRSLEVHRPQRGFIMDNSLQTSSSPGDIILSLPLGKVAWGNNHDTKRIAAFCLGKFGCSLDECTLQKFAMIPRKEVKNTKGITSELLGIMEEKLHGFGLGFGLTVEKAAIFRARYTMTTFLKIAVDLIDWGGVHGCNCMDRICQVELGQRSWNSNLREVALIRRRAFQSNRTGRGIGKVTFQQINDTFAALGLHMEMSQAEIDIMLMGDTEKGKTVLSSAMDSTVKVKVNPHGGPLPYNHEGKGDWYDLFVAEDVDMKAGEFRLISMGVSIMVPSGYTAYVLPRSSTFKKFGLLQTNSMGVIDSSYCGDGDIIKFPALATRDIHISKGDRIAQITVMPSSSINWVPVSTLGNEDRGGFGSTGV